MSDGDRSNPAPPWLTDAAFVVWSPRYKGTRSAWLASELGLPDPTFLAPTARRGAGAALAKYPRQAVATLAHLVRRRPTVVFVQTPPSFAAWIVALYAMLARAAIVVDAHSDAFNRTIWTKPEWLNRFVTRRAAATIVTARHWAHRIESMGGHAVVVPAIPTQLTVGEPPPLAGFSVAVVTTWAPDEPVDAVMEAARLCPGATFYVTGKPRHTERISGALPPNVVLTGFLAEPTYNGLLAHAGAVLCLTTRDHTMQNGAAEALYLGTPIITSDWDVLREYFSRGTIHVDNSPAAIAAAVTQMMENGESYRAEVRALREEIGARWHAERSAILASIHAQLRRLGRVARADR